MDKQREKLIELLSNVPADVAGNIGVGAIADHILADGWIRPPCKVGDKVWIPSVNSNKVLSRTVKEILIREKDGDIDQYICCGCAYFPFENIGKTVFLSREDAEKALEGVE